MKMINDSKVTTMSRIVTINWGANLNPVEEYSFSDISNLLTGGSGTGKTTLLDAIMVILLGTNNPSIFNTAKGTKGERGDVKRNARGYALGSRHNFLPLRDGMDFYSCIAIEFHDNKTDKFYVAGIMYLVKKDNLDSTPEHKFFTVNGPLPDDKFVNYTFDTLENFVAERSQLYGTKIDNVCKVYSDDRTYAAVSCEKIFGYGPALADDFRRLIQSIIQVKIPANASIDNFVKEFLFVKTEDISTNSVIEKAEIFRNISDELAELSEIVKMLDEIEGIINKYEDAKSILAKEDELTNHIRLTLMEEEINTQQAAITALENELKKKIDEREKNQRIKDALVEKKVRFEEEFNNSPIGNIKEKINAEKARLESIDTDINAWNEFKNRLSKWVTKSEYIYDEVSDIISRGINERDFDDVELTSIKENVVYAKKTAQSDEKAYSDEIKKTKGEIEKLREDIKNLSDNRGIFKDRDTEKVRKRFEDILRKETKQSVEVRTFAKTFDIVDDEWRDAIEGWLGRVKGSFIVAPQYYEEAIKIHKRLGISIRLIDTKKMIDKPAEVFDNSLVTATTSPEDYVVKTLNYYLGRVIKCDNEKMFSDKRIENGVTKDAYAYRQRQSGPLKKEDYRDYATIGLSTPIEVIEDKMRELQELEDKVENLQEKYSQITEIINYCPDLSYISNEYIIKCEAAPDIKDECKQKLEALVNELNELESKNSTQIIKDKISATIKEIEDTKRAIQGISDDTDKLREELTRKNSVREYTKRDFDRLSEEVDTSRISETIEAVKEWRDHNRYTKRDDTVCSQRRKETEFIRREVEQLTDELYDKKRSFLNRNPSYTYSNNPDSNEKFIALKNEKKSQLDNDIHNRYEAEYENTINELKEVVIAKLSSDIDNAYRTVKRINHTFRGYVFGKTIFTLKSEPAAEYKDYFPMLMSENLTNLALSAKFLTVDELMEQDGNMKIFNEYISFFIPPKRSDYMKLDPTGKEIFDEKGYTLAHDEFKRKLSELTDYRNYLEFSLGNESINIDSFSDEEKKQMLAGSNVSKKTGTASGGQAKTPVYVVLFIAVKMLCSTVGKEQKSPLSLMMMDESFNDMDAARTKTLIKMAADLGLQLVLCAPDKEGASFNNWTIKTYNFMTDSCQRSVSTAYERNIEDVMNTLSDE